MSPAVSFKSVVVVTSQGVRLWTLNRKTWTESKTRLSLESTPSSEAVALTQGSNLLVLVSDAFTGHLQFTAPNKKDELTDEALGERLQNDYQIDVAAYEFAMQRSTLTRTEMQVSVSGIETAIYKQIQSFVAVLQPRKTWLMPLGWFLSPLKSVEPVLLAVVGAKDQVYISHHYLGVDDARELNLSELTEYVQSRKEERKETHLLYIQAPARAFKKLESSLSELVAVHPLIADPSSGDPLTDVITEVMAKGPDTLNELLHFEEVGSAAPDIESEVEGQEAESTESQSNSLESTTVSVTETITMVGPAPVLGSTTEVSGIAASELDGEDEDSYESVMTPSAEDLPQPRLPQPVSPVRPARTRVAVTEEVSIIESQSEPAETPSQVEPEEQLEAAVVEPEQEPEPVDAISRLAAEKTPLSSAQRYREVEKSRSWGLIGLVFVAVVAITVLVGGAIFWSQQPQPQQNALIPAETQPTPTPSPTPTPTPQPDILTLAEKAQLNMVVVNATTKAGLAGRYQAELKKAGWSISSAGNATGNYTESAVYVYAKDDSVFETLSRELEGVSVRRMTENLEKSASTVDIVVAINQAVEPKVTPADAAPAASGSATTP